MMGRSAGRGRAEASQLYKLPWSAAGLIFVAFLNALCYPLIAIGLESAPQLPFAALRAILAGAALATIAVALRRPLPRNWGSWAVLAAIGLGTTTFGYLGMFHAAEFISPGLATMIGNSQPLIAAILALVFLSERPNASQQVGLVLGFLGILAISVPQLNVAGRSEFSFGLAYIALATSGVAVGNVLMKSLGTSVDPLVAMASQSLLGAIPLAVGALLLEQPSQISWSPTFLFVLLGLALPGTALAYWLWFSLLRRVPLSRANAFTFLTPFIGLTLGVAFFGERPGFAALVGLSVTGIGIVLVERGSPAASSPTAKETSPAPRSSASM